MAACGKLLELRSCLCQNDKFKTSMDSLFMHNNLFMPGMVAHTSNPCIQEVEAGGQRVKGQHLLHSNSNRRLGWAVHETL